MTGKQIWRFVYLGDVIFFVWIIAVFSAFGIYNKYKTHPVGVSVYLGNSYVGCTDTGGVMIGDFEVCSTLCRVDPVDTSWNINASLVSYVIGGNETVKDSDAQIISSMWGESEYSPISDKERKEIINAIQESRGRNMAEFWNNRNKGKNADTLRLRGIK